MKMKSIIFAVFFLCLFGILHADSGDEVATRRFGLFIGANNGGPDRIRLLYAANDARNMMKTMTDLGGISNSDSVLLVDPSVYSVFQNLEQIAEAVRKAKKIDSIRRIEVVFYYSGHSDENGLMIGNDVINYTTLRDRLKTVDADVIIAMLDSCASGAFTRTKGGSKAPPFIFDESVNASGHAYLTSSSADEASQESDKIQGSFFTYYLISGLRGAADATYDRKVTLNELYQHAYKETLARTENTLGGPQHPSYEIQLSGTGDLILTDLNISTSTLVFSNDIRGRVYIRDSYGRLVAELKKDAGYELSMALPAGNYSLNLVSEEASYNAAVFLKDGITTALMPYHLKIQAPELTTLRGDNVASITDTETTTEEDDSSDGDDSVTEAPSDEENTAQQDHDNKMINLVNDPDANTFSSFLEVLFEFGNEVMHSSNNFSFNIFPDLSAPDDLADDTWLSLGLFFSYANRVQATQLSTIFSVANSDVTGFQAGGIGNFTSGSLYGVQLGSVYNQTIGSIHGVQTGTINIGNSELYGLQIAALINYTAQNSLGLQLSGVANLTGLNANGAQIAGVFNVSGNESTGAQIAGLFNLTEGIHSGLQLAGILNKADTLNGTQIGLINFAGTRNGVQIGLINYSDTGAGIPIGLLNLTGDGIIDFSLWYETNEGIFTGFQSGSKNVYTIVYAGTKLFDFEDFDNIVYGGGFGSRVTLGPIEIEMDLTVRSGVGDHQMFMPVLRADAGLKIGETVLFGGISALGVSDGLLSDGTQMKDSWMVAGADSIFSFGTPWGTSYEVLPQFFAGIRF